MLHSEDWQLYRVVYHQNSLHLKTKAEEAEVRCSRQVYCVTSLTAKTENGMNKMKNHWLLVLNMSSLS